MANRSFLNLHVGVILLTDKGQLKEMSHEDVQQTKLPNKVTPTWNSTPNSTNFKVCQQVSITLQMMSKQEQNFVVGTIVSSCENKTLLLAHLGVRNTVVCR